MIIMYTQTRDHEITRSPEKSHTRLQLFSIKIFTTSDQHISLYTAYNNWEVLNLWLERKSREQ